MMWEADRYDWNALRALGSARDVPAALWKLARSSSAAEAESAYWRIDNVVVVQGALYQAALPTAACAVIALGTASPLGRLHLLELLVQLALGEPHPSEVALGNSDLPKGCAAEAMKGYAQYLIFLESCGHRERIACIDLLGLLAQEKPSLRDQVRVHFARLLQEEIEPQTRLLADEWLADL